MIGPRSPELSHPPRTLAVQDASGTSCASGNADLCIVCNGIASVTTPGTVAIEIPEHLVRWFPSSQLIRFDTTEYKTVAVSTGRRRPRRILVFRRFVRHRKVEREVGRPAAQGLDLAEFNTSL